MAIVVIIITTTIITILNIHDHTSHRVRLCGHVLLLLLTIIITSIVIIIIISIIIIIVISTIPQASPAIVVVTVSSTQLTCHPRVLYLTSIRTALRSYKFHIVSTPNMSVGNVLRKVKRTSGLPQTTTLPLALDVSGGAQSAANQAAVAFERARTRLA